MPKRMIAGNDWSLSRVDDHAVIGPANAMPVSTANGHGEQQPPRAGRGEQHQHDRHAGRGERAPRGVPERGPRRHVAGPQRRRRHRPVGVAPREAVHHRPHRLLGDDDHRRRRQQRRGEEGEVVDAAEDLRRRRSFVDERADADAHPEQVQQRLDQAAEQVRLARSACTRRSCSPRRGRRRASHHRRAQSTSVRPVRRRKTSSRLLRRTSALSGVTPRSWTIASAFSPSSA